MRLNKFIFFFVVLVSQIILAQNVNSQETKKIYYSSGTLRSECHINKDSVSNGSCKIFHENGKLMGEGFFDNGKWSGEWKFYNYDGMLDEIGSHKNGLREGKWYYFYLIDTDTIVVEQNYKKGCLEGESVRKKNNTIIEKITYIEGIKTESIMYSNRIYGSFYDGIELSQILNLDSMGTNGQGELIYILSIDSLIYSAHFDENTWKILNQSVSFLEVDTSLLTNYKSEKHTFYDKEGVPITQKNIFFNNKGQVVKICTYTLSTMLLEKGEKRLVENGSFYESAGALCTPPSEKEGRIEYFLNNGKCFLKYDVKVDEGGSDLLGISSPFELFYPNGHLNIKGQFCCSVFDLKKTGKWVYFDQNGKTIREENFN